MNVTQTSTTRQLGWLGGAFSRHFFVFLLAAIALAATAPSAGIALRQMSLRCGPVELYLSQLLVASMLLIATFSADRSSAPQGFLHHLYLVVIALGARLLAAGLAVWMLLQQPEQQNFYLIGLALTFSMPSAFSSIGWTTKAEGSQNSAIRLVLASTFLVPLVFPLISALGQEQGVVPVTHVVRLLLFIGCCGLIGRLVARVVSPQQRAQIKPVLRSLNLMLILVLNYANASAALRDILSQPRPMLLIVAAASIVSCVGVFWLSHLVSNRLAKDSSETTAFTFTTGMYNTGLSIVVIPALLPDIQECLLAPLVVVITQHFVASAWDAVVVRGR